MNFSFIPRFFPSPCVLCKDTDSSGTGICAHCVKTLPQLGHACQRCALPIAGNSPLCGTCSSGDSRSVRIPSVPLRQTVCLFNYTHPADHLIGSFKFGGRLSVGRALGRLLADHLQTGIQTCGDGAEVDYEVDYIVPMPLSAPRYRERGFNQARELARVVSRRLSIPMADTLLSRPGHRVPQVSLSRTERQTNVKNAFVCSSEVVAEVAGVRFALVDDVMTTGATVYEAARTLLASGAASVDAWVVARTAPD